MQRLQSRFIKKDLAKKIVLIVGPRQVGKTYLAKQIAKEYDSPVYLNFDNLEDRQMMQQFAWMHKTDLLILDELHKMPGWKNYLKGLFDTKPEHLHIIVTGSARLEVFNKIGDSLAGRYYLHRLLPLSPAELKQTNFPYNFDHLLREGGFPEPFLAENGNEAARWRYQYVNSMLSTDVFDFDVVQNIRALQTLFELLRSKVGSPISYQGLAEDLAVAPNTVKKYLGILEALFIIFRITPFSKNIARSILKEPKIYFFDNGLLKNDDGASLENFIACCLLKHVYAKIDYFGENYSLNYLRTKDGLEVDFALVKDQEIEQIIEVKNSMKDIAKSLYSFHNKYNLPAVQVVKELRQNKLNKNIKIIKAEEFLAELFL